jgi:hypothetical protein
VLEGRLNRPKRSGGGDHRFIEPAGVTPVHGQGIANQRGGVVLPRAKSSSAGVKDVVEEEAQEYVDLVTVEEEPTARRTIAVGRGVSSMTAAKLGMEPEVEVLPEAQAWMERQDARLKRRVEEYVARLDTTRNGQATEAEAAVAEAGEVTVGPYVGLDVLAYSPIQSIGTPPYAPHKIIRGGEQAVIWALVFVNPAADIPNGFAVPATVQLSGRGFRVRFDQIDLTNVSNGPDFTFTGTFPSPAPALTWIPFPFTAPDPGLNPRLMEANIAVDITDMAQPWAAFATWHFDIESDPGFLGFIPSVPPQLQHDIPMRYLIYRG